MDREQGREEKEREKLRRNWRKKQHRTLFGDKFVFGSSLPFLASKYETWIDHGRFRVPVCAEVCSQAQRCAGFWDQKVSLHFFWIKKVRNLKHLMLLFSSISRKKKKKKSKKEDRDLEESLPVASTSSSSTTAGEDSKSSNSEVEKYYAKKTKSEIAFLKRKEERVRI